MMLTGWAPGMVVLAAKHAAPPRPVRRMSTALTRMCASTPRSEAQRHNPRSIASMTEGRSPATLIIASTEPTSTAR